MADQMRGHYLPAYAQERVAEVLDGFDFRVASAILEGLGWRWAAADGPPSAEMMRNRAEELLEHAAHIAVTQGGVIRVGSGGLLAFAAADESGRLDVLELSLQPVRSTWESEDA